MSALPINRWIEQARRDDWHKTFVGSDIRQMLSEIICLQALNDRILEALQSAPIIGAGESSEDFRVRQDAWLNGQYRAAIAKATGAS